MSGNLNVLAPNGRRQNVKFSPNMTILQIIEKVCEKQGFESAEYDLKHQRKVLDPKLSVRFSNIPNNAKLELIKSKTPRTETSTQIVLQLPDGQRLQHPFKPSSTLWDIVQHWEEKLNRKLVADDEGQQMEPCLVYMTHTIAGESKLKETKLRSLGLTGGSAVIRLSGRIMDSNTENKSTAEIPHTDIQESTTERHLEKEENIDISQSPQDEISQSPQDMEITEAPEQLNIESKSNFESSTSPQAMDVQEESEKPTISTEMTQERTVEFAHQSYTMNIEASNIRTEKHKQVDVRRKEGRKYDRREPLQNNELRSNEFANFKFPDPVSNVDSNLQMNIDESDEVIPQTCEREAVVFNLDNGSTSDSNTEIPDDFFEVTVDDIRKMLADLKHQRTNDAPLETTKMRENKAKQKMLQYKKTVIRVVFPDKTVLQGFFSPQETLQHLFEFVQKSLQDTKLLFYLYTSPPKTILKNSNETTLFSAGLFPSAKVYFGSRSPQSTWLSSALLTSISPISVANESLRSVTGNVESSINKPSTSREEQTADYNQQQTTPAPNKRPSPSTSHDSNTNSQKIPKWFKLGKQ